MFLFIYFCKVIISVKKKKLFSAKAVIIWIHIYNCILNAFYILIFTWYVYRKCTIVKNQNKKQEKKS